jgi:hypothetical protein
VTIRRPSIGDDGLEIDNRPAAPAIEAGDVTQLSARAGQSYGEPALLAGSRPVSCRVRFAHHLLAGIEDRCLSRTLLVSEGSVFGLHVHIFVKNK